MGDKVAALIFKESNWRDPGIEYDPFLQKFAQGAKAQLSPFTIDLDIRIPLIIRGVGGGSRKAIQNCWKTGRNFYIIDTGYFGNVKHKTWHRVTKNNLQNLGPVVPHGSGRLETIGYQYVPFTSGETILICPPSEKVMMIFDQPSPEQWTKNVINELKKYTDRPIEVRLKPTRRERVSTDTIQSALQKDVHCLITYNSIAAVEALMAGKPAIALGPNAAQIICNTSLSDVNNLNKPIKSTMKRFLSHLAYSQFTEDEIQNGYCWETMRKLG